MINCTEKAMEQFFVYLVQQPNIYYKEIDGRLHSISKEEFEKLDNVHKIKVLRIIENAVAAITGEIPFDQTPAKIQQIRRAYLGFPEWKTILSINENKLPIRKALPPTIETMKEALEWLKNSGIPYLLKFAEFRDFDDMTSEELKELILICPNLEYLSFESDVVDTIPELPDSLLELDCMGSLIEMLPPLPPKLTKLSICGTSIRQLPNLPDPLLMLNCSLCDFLEKWPEKLPPFIREIDCSDCSKLEPLPYAAPSSLKKLRNDGGPKIQRYSPNKLRTPREITDKNIGDTELSTAKRARVEAPEADERNVRNKPSNDN